MMSWSRGQGRAGLLRGAFQAGAGGLEAPADEPRFRSEGARSPEKFSVCWLCSGSCGWSDQPDLCSLPLPFLTEEPQRRVSQWGQGLSGQLSSVAGVCVCLWVTQSGPHASSRGNSIMEIVWWPSRGTGSRGKLALEYFELAVMKANGNLPCLQA